ncbi:paired-like homeodomain transcription factor LEUTX isoform X4 [Bubalus kerabau]|uniref:paired-like homeodomain transcription factor LEUTX isoform X4 n=1 Tax=Bubalus carabanensis TaxID=3119969 RepID=UPI00244ECB72|nr:paired-like homeodomain transcription factor LEUTX isoform X4 [Bubalus carabanensis]
MVDLSPKEPLCLSYNSGFFYSKRGGSNTSGGNVLMTFPQSSSEKRNSTQRFRTRFNGEQLGALRDVFERTRYPHWFLIRTLASTIHLDASVIKTWFKNQRVKRRREENQTRQNLSPGDPRQVVSVKEEEMPLPGTSGSIHPTSLSLADSEFPKASVFFKVEPRGQATIQESFCWSCEGLC